MPVVPGQPSLAAGHVDEGEHVALEALPLDRIRTKGYAFQIETTFRALRAGFEVQEIPIVFAERRSGGSKMTRGIVLEAMLKVPELRLRSARNHL